jgi:hypothetical protein
MSFWGALVLGLFLALASFLNGGVWAPGHDFVVNRFTGEYVFVPAEDEESEATAEEAAAGLCALTSRRPGVRVARSARERGAFRATRVGR